MMVLAHLAESTLVAGAIAALLAAIPNVPARTRHALWLCASLKFLVPLSVLALVGRTIGEQLSVPPLADGLPLRLFSSSASVEALGGNVAAFLAPVALGLWFAGIVAVGTWRWRQWREVTRVASASSPMIEGREFRALERIAATFRVAGCVELRSTASRLEPGVLGAFRPTLLWPSDLSERLSDVELDAILAHETCHVARRDNLASLAHVVVETMFWFHPLVWWLGTRLTTERERACDEEVLQMGTNSRSYAEGIVKVCDFCLRAPAAFVAGVTGMRLADRVEGILRWQRTAAPRWTAHIPALVILLVVALPLAIGASSTTVAQDKKVYKQGDGVKMPVLVRELKPKYTAAAMSAKIQGSVWLQAVVLENGDVSDVKITKSLDAEHGLDEEAIKCLKQWTFKPGTKEDKPVPVLIEVEMTFKLK